MPYHCRWKGGLERLIKTEMDMLESKRDPGAQGLRVSMFLTEGLRLRRPSGQRVYMPGQTAFYPCNPIRVVKASGGCAVEEGDCFQKALGTFSGTFRRADLLDGRADARAFRPILEACGSAQMHTLLSTFDIRHFLLVVQLFVGTVAGKTRRVRLLDQRVRLSQGRE